MPKSIASTGDFILPEEDTLYKARLKAVQEETITPHDKTKKSFQKWRWIFEIMDGDPVGVEVRGDTWPRITLREDDIARQWYETLIGHEVKAGEDCDTDLVVGRECTITVKHGEPYSRRDGQGMITPVEVLDVMPAEDIPF